MTSYAPEVDGEPDPGEVVWGWVPYEDDPQQGKDRPVLLIARSADGADGDGNESDTNATNGDGRGTRAVAGSGAAA